MGSRLTPPLPADGRSARVAVVIPCFNEGREVVEAWCSLAHEEPHEAVIVDDGSDDPETRSVLEILRRSGATVIRRENGGLAAARGTGVAATGAPYILPLDGDDILAPGSLTRLADALDANEQSVAAWGDLRVFGSLDRIDPKGTRIDPWLLTHVHDLHSGLMIRRDALAAVGGWHDVVFEDWDLTLALAGRGWSGSHVPGTQVYYRVDEGGLLSHAPYQRGLRQLRGRHGDLFAGRRRLEASSSVSWPVRRIFSLIDLLPGAGAAPRAAHKDAILRRSDSRRRVSTPPPGTPEPVVAARRAAEELIAADRGENPAAAQAGVRRQ